MAARDLLTINQTITQWQTSGVWVGHFDARTKALPHKYEQRPFQRSFGDLCRDLLIIAGLSTLVSEAAIG
jgi:hypothetical protein